MRLGFTGTQYGMTPMQSQFVFDEMMMLSQIEHISEAHHGICIGADKEFHEMLAYMQKPLEIHGHPPSNTSKMAKLSYPCDVMHEPKPYLERNRDIDNACTWLIAAPRGKEEQRSGTWNTVRYARRIGRPASIIMPDATIIRERVPNAYLRR